MVSAIWHRLFAIDHVTLTIGHCQFGFGNVALALWYWPCGICRVAWPFGTGHLALAMWHWPFGIGLVALVVRNWSCVIGHLALGHVASTIWQVVI